MIIFILNISLNEKPVSLLDMFDIKPEIDLYYSEPEYECVVWGDPIIGNNFREGLKKNNSIEYLLYNIYGHFYYLYLNKLSGNLYLGNSLFSILPVYYFIKNNLIVLSENAIIMGKYIEQNKINKRFVLETLLFNYPLFSNSVIDGIMLLPSNSYLLISNGKVSVTKHTFIENFFEEKPLPWKKSVGMMTDVFIGTVKKYLPDMHYASSLTGGFDGRTLTAAGLYYKRDFSTYTFGTESAKDISIAEKLSLYADIPFIKIVLDEDYINKSNIECGEEFIINSSATATFARAHYLFAAKKLSSEFKHVVTGNFGSEVFRAAHIAGVVISKNLYNIFNSDTPEKAFDLIEESPEFNCLNEDLRKEEWESLKEDILKLPCFNRNYNSLTRNQKFYLFVFEELFRKYFGAEMINQFKYLKNRTPFLDIDFLKELFKTELAGIHSKFFEHNPLKRYKGQVLYAHIINKAYPPFGKIVTDKGYRPDDLLSFLGKLHITRGYLKKIAGRKSLSDSDPYAVNKAWENNKNFWLNNLLPGDFFDSSRMSEDISREILFKILSLSYVIEEIYLPPGHEGTRYIQYRQPGEP